MKNDKCDLCALKVIFDQGSLEKERHIEDLFATLRQLQKDGIIGKGYNRRSFDGNGAEDKSEMCALNAKFFLQDNKDKKCPEFILNMNLSVPDALSLNLSKKNFKLTSSINFLTYFLVLLTVALLFFAAYPFIPTSLSPKQYPIKIEKNINPNTEHNQQHNNNVPNYKNERHK